MRNQKKRRIRNRWSSWRAAVKVILALMLMAQAWLAIPPKPAAALPNPLELANELGRQVLSQLPIEPYRSLVENIVNGEHPLIGAGANFFGKLRPNMEALICHMQTYAKIPFDLLQIEMPGGTGTCPTFQVQATEAGGEPASSADQQTMSRQFVQQLAGMDGETIVRLLKEAFLDFNAGIDLPSDGGKAWAKKSGADLSACVWLKLGDARALFGISNEDQLCGGKTDSLANPGNIMTAFLDVTLDGYNYVFASVPVPVAPVNTIMPKFEAVGYAPLPDNQYFKVEFGALKDAKVTADFIVGIGASFDYIGTVEAEAVASLSVEVVPDKLTRLVNGASKRMADAMQNIVVKGLTGQDGQALLTPQDAADVLLAATTYIRNFEAGEPGSIGSLTLGLELTASAGVGIWDTKWPLIAGTFSLNYGIPLDRLAHLTADVLREYIQSAVKMSDLISRLGASLLSGEASGNAWNDALNTLNSVWQHDLIPAIQDSLGDVGGMFGDSVLEAGLSFNMIGEGGGQHGSETTVEPIALSLEVPIGLVAANALSGDFWSESLQWLLSMLPDAFKELLYGDSPAPAFQPGDLGGIPAATVFSLKISPLVPGLAFTAELPAQGLHALLQAGAVTTSAFVDAVVDSVKEGSLAPFEVNAIQLALAELDKDIREGIVIGMQLGAGTNGKLGAEAEVAAGVGFEIFGETNLEMLLFLGSMGHLNNSAASGESSFGMSVSLDGSLGLNIGEGVELSASGGVSASENLFTVALSELDDPAVRPPHVAYVPESADAYLKSLSLGQGLTLNEPFSPSTYAYTASIPYEYNASTFDVRAATQQANARLSIDGAPNISGAPVSVKLNASGVNRIVIRATSEDGSQTRDYLVETQRASNTKLKSLTVGVIGDIFGSVELPVGTGTVFNCQVDSDAMAVGIQVETESAFAAATINGVSTKRIAIYPLPGVNTYTITVSSMDGAVPGGVKQATYTLRVEKLKSSNTLLEDLTVGGSYYYSGVRFDPRIGAYSKTVAANVTHIDVVSEMSDLLEGATVTVNGTAVTSGNRIRVPLAYGNNSIKVKVTAEDGVHYREYLVLVTRESLVPFTSLEVIGGAMLSQPFDPSKTVQKLTVVNSQSPYYFRATYAEAAGSNRFIRYYGTVDMLGGVWSGGNPPMAGFALPVVMWSQAGSDWNRTPYIFVISDPKASGNADLKGLKLTSGPDVPALSPAFQKSITSYTVNASSSAIQIEPVRDDPGSTVFVNGEYANSGVYTVFLSEGVNEIPIIVAAQDGTTKTYKLTVNYKEIMGNADLASLTCTGCVSNIANFNAATTIYTVDVPSNTSGITISAQAAVRNAGPSQTSASIGIFHAENILGNRAEYAQGSNALQIPRSGLAPGVNTFLISVYSASQQMSKTYTIKANLLPSSDNALSQLKVLKEDASSEWFGAAFSPGKLDYSLAVPENISQVWLRAWPNQADAMLKVNGQLWNSYTDLPIYLLPGVNPIRVEVTAQDKTSKRTYLLNVRRKDALPPTLVLPGDLQAEAASRSGAAVSFAVSAQDAADGAIAPICSRESGSVFAIGTTTVSCSATDLDGNKTTGSFSVTVSDTTAPVLQGLSDKQVSAGDPVAFAAAASDAVDDKPAVSCTRASGSVLPVGLTQVTCIATDFSGNASYGHFTVTVTDAEAPHWAGGSLLQAVQVTPRSMRLYWPIASDNVGVAKYRVYRVEGSTRYLLAEVNNLTYDAAGLEPNTIYTFAVYAGDESNNWSPVGLVGTIGTPEEPDTEAPVWPPETQASADAVVDAGMTLFWTPASDNKGVKSYRIYENGVLMATAPASDLIWNGAAYEYPLSGLLPDTVYAFKIAAGDDAGNWSAEGPTFTARTEASPPVAMPPTWPPDAEATVSGVTENGLILFWTPAVDDTQASQYRVYRNNILLGTVQTADLTVTGNVYGYPVTNLLPDTEYVFKIEAGDDEDNWSSDGPGVTARTLASAPPDPVEEPEAPDAQAPTWPDLTMTATAVTDTGLTLNWLPAVDNKGATRYGIYKDDSLIVTVLASELSVTGSVYGYSVTDLKPSTRYFFKIIAGDDALNWSPDGPALAVATASVQPDPGGGPTGSDTQAPTWPGGSLTVSGITDTGLRLTWSAAWDDTGISGYRIYVNGASSGEAGGGATSWDLTGLQPSSPYLFVIEAVDAAGNWSTNGPSAAAVTQASASQNPPDEDDLQASAPHWPQDSSLAATGIGVHELELNWSQAVGHPTVAAYRIYVNGDLFTEADAVTRNYALTGLQANSLYTIKIEAGDAGGRWSADGPQLTLHTMADPDAGAVDRMAPFWPQNSEIIPSKITENGMRLDWTTADDDTAVSHYRIYRNGLVIATLPGSASNYAVDGLSPDTTYLFKVEAGDASGNWSHSGPNVSVVTLQAAPPSTDGGGYSEPGTKPDTEAEPSPERDGGKWHHFREDELAEGQAGQGDTTSIILGEGETGALFPLAAIEQLDARGRNLEVKAHGLTLSIPSGVLSALVRSEGLSANDDVQVGLTVRKVEKPNEGQPLQLGANFSVQEFGVYEFEWSIVTKEGAATVARPFAQPLRIAIPYDPRTAQTDLLGVYTFNTESKQWEYVGGTVDPNNHTITVSLSHFSAYAVLELDRHFADVPENHWAYDALRILSAKHIVTGVSESSFAPNARTTRAEFATLLVRALGLRTDRNENVNAVFADVDSTDWYAEAVSAAYGAGLIAGRPEGRFDPNATITREEMAVMLVRAYAYGAGKAGIVGDNAADDTEDRLEDRERISSWAASYVSVAIREQLMLGTGNNRFDPLSTATRAESAQAIYNLIKKLR